MTHVKTATLPETTETVHDIAMDYRRVKVSFRTKDAKHLAQRIRDAKVLPNMGTTFAECRSKANAQNDIVNNV